MDKNAIKKYAVWARNELIARVTQKAEQYEITEKKTTPKDADSIGGRLLTETEKNQRKALIEKIQVDGFEQVMEEVAYTWFNRFTALRFMEVNNYLPSHTRVFTNEQSEFKPQILADAIQLDLEGLNMDKVFELKDANKTEELYKYLLITQCNALSAILPRMFQKIEHYTELLLPDYLLREGSVIEQMIALIPEEDWTDQVQIIGWLYQYYNSEPKDAVFAALKKNVKISKENIPAATQLFTPDWIVRYMVENSLGRLWLEGHPNDALKSEWKYYLDEAEQEADVQKQLDKIRKEYAALKPEEIRCIDPCMGSGHILCVLFDTLVRIYEQYGYSAREAVESIVRYNIWGTDIDERAAQLSYFAVMMKARQYDRRFLTRGIQPHVYAVEESNDIRLSQIQGMKLYRDQGKAKEVDTLIKELHNAKIYGSLIDVSKADWGYIKENAAPIDNEGQLRIDTDGVGEAAEKIKRLADVGQTLSQKYHVVVTNPPYLSSGNMSGELSDYLKLAYPGTKSDLCTCFIEKSFKWLFNAGFSSMITMESWMSLSSYKELRNMILNQKTITDLLHMPYLGKGGTSLGINFGTAATIIRNAKISSYDAEFSRVVYTDCDEDGVPYSFPVKDEYYNTTKPENFELIPGSPVSSYYATKEVFNCFVKGVPISEVAVPASGTSTGDNDSFLRLWHEVPISHINFSAQNGKFADLRWFPCNKGGAYRRWAGGSEYVIDWEDDGRRVKSCPKAYLRNVGSIFKPGLTWSKLGSGAFSIRFFKEGYICESIGCCLFKGTEDLDLILALLNSVVGSKLLSIINPSMGRQPGYIGAVPFISDDQSRNEIKGLTTDCIRISQEDWDSFETSWGFLQNPLLGKGKLSVLFQHWDERCRKRFEQLKSNEERINEILIELYGLEKELKPDVLDEMVSVHLANEKEDIINLISYAVGCMFGRYSIDTPGIIFAGGAWDSSAYKTYQPDKDAIIPVCDDEYFEDDIVGRFVEFVRVVYGEDVLEENLRYIANALGGKGTSRDVIRNYFINDFYNDHLRLYQKRPIYWMFDSGKKNGFKCLVYMHRYQTDTIARIRTDYVHEQQSRYRTAINDLENRINGAGTSDRVKLNKQLTTLQDQATEIREYEEKIHHLADQMISIDLDAGVKHNYEMFKDVLAKLK